MEIAANFGGALFNKRCNLPGQARRRQLQPCPWELDAIPEHAQVELDAIPEHAQVAHVTPATRRCSMRRHDDAALEAGGSPQDRMVEVAQLTRTLIDTMYSGEGWSVAGSVAQMCLRSRTELELVAQILVSKASADPQYSEACAVAACALQKYLPLLLGPPCQGKKAEKFMHVLLDVFQTEFEHLFLNPTGPLKKTSPIHQDNCARQDGGNRERAILHFGAHLYRLRLLGERVVRLMVHDLIECGSAESARELLHVAGVVP